MSALAPGQPIRQLASTSMPSWRRQELGSNLAREIASGDALTPVGHPRLIQLEEMLAAYVGWGEAVAMSSGTAALQVAVDSLLDDRPGDRFVLVTTAFSYMATAMPALWSRTRLRLVDVADHGLLPDDDEVASAVRDVEGIPVLVAVHLGGDLAAWPLAREATRRRGGFVIDDAAQRLAPWPGLDTDAVCLSLGPTKNICGIGEGGALVAADAQLVTKARASVRNGNRGLFEHDRRGGNLIMSPLHATALVDHLPLLADWDLRRRQVAARYDNAVGAASSFRLLSAPDSVRSKYCCLYGGPRALLETHAAVLGVEVDWHYPRGLHRQPALAHLVDPSHPRADRLSQDIVSLPMHQFLSDADCDRVVRLVVEVDALTETSEEANQ